MSHFTRVKTKIMDEDCLIKALADLGFTQIEHGERLPLYGWKGKKRQQTAEIAIRRKHLGSASNDIGFAKLDDGTYEIIISEYDVGGPYRNFEDNVQQRYAYHRVKQQAEYAGYTIVGEEVNEDGSIQLLYQQW